MILVVLGGVIIAVYARAFHRPTAPSRPATPLPTETQLAVSHEVGAASPVPSSTLSAIPILPEKSPQHEAQRKEAVRLSWGRDPFAQDLPAKQAAIALALTGILWDANQPMAIINGRTLSVGQELDGYRVTSISPDHVSLTDGNHTLELSIAH